jgi:hypothetical protein
VTVEQYVVEYSTNGTTWEALSNVQSIVANIGRQGLQDIFEPSSANIVCRYPNGYATPNTALVVGTRIRFSRTGGLYTMWSGRIRNVTVSWGKPYVASVGNEDSITIECEGALAEFGRFQGNGQTIDTDLATYQLSDVSTYTGITFGTTFTVANSPTLATSTVDGSYAEWFNTFANTLGATIKDGSGQVGVNTKDFVGTLPVSFSDVANNATNQVFDELQFDSLAADYYTQVEVNTNAFGTVTVNTGSAPYRTLRISTFSGSTGQATDLANYYLGIYSNPGFGISSISAKAEAQNTFALDLGYGWWDLPGYRCNLTFRGATYYLQILGCQFSATPNGARYSYSVVSGDLTPYLILDDPVYGILDTNKLSW